MKIRRPAIIDLMKDDVLFYLHIPKTGGLSLISILDHLYPEDQILPIHSDVVENVFSGFSEEQLSNFRFARGHFRCCPYDNGIYRHLVQNPVRITMMRDPVTRIVSSFRYIKRNPRIEIHPRKITINEQAGKLDPSSVVDLRQERVSQEIQDLTLDDFIEDPRYFRLIYNRQSYLISGGVRGFPSSRDDLNSLSEEAILQIAKDRLNQFVFIGIMEKFRESCLLLAYLLRIPPIEEIPFLNTAPHSTSRDELSPKTLNAIIEMNQIDLELYEHAKNLFEQQWYEMVTALIGSVSRPSLSNHQ